MRYLLSSLGGRDTTVATQERPHKAAALFPPPLPSFIRSTNKFRSVPKEYQSASPEEKEAFHEKGLRRLNEDKVVMPSGRVLQSKVGTRNGVRGKRQGTRDFFFLCSMLNPPGQLMFLRRKRCRTRATRRRRGGSTRSRRRLEEVAG